MQERHLDDPVTSEEPNSLHFSAVISAFAEQGDVENARAVLQRIIDSDAQPHEGCFNGVIKAYVRSQRPDAPEKAEGILRWMMQQPGNFMSPDVVTFTSCISIYCNSFCTVSFYVEK